MAIRKKQLDKHRVEKMICAREEGMPIWKIADAFGIPINQATDIIREKAPHVYRSTPYIQHSWQVYILSKQGKSYREIGKVLGISVGTAFRAYAVGRESWDRRNPSYRV